MQVQSGLGSSHTPLNYFAEVSSRCIYPSLKLAVNFEDKFPNLVIVNQALNALNLRLVCLNYKVGHCAGSVSAHGRGDAHARAGDDGSGAQRRERGTAQRQER